MAMRRRAEPSAPPCGDDALKAATGRTWDEWCAILDAAGADGKAHGEIASLAHAVDPALTGWWGQAVTVGYERLRGLRATHETASGYAASASKTLDAPAEAVFDALADDARRERWLPGAFRVTKATPHRTLRGKTSDGRPMSIQLVAKGDARCAVTFDVQKLPDADAVPGEKARWRAALDALAAEVAR